MGEKPLTMLQEKLGEAHGLAIAAAVVVQKVAAMIETAALREPLEAMREDAEETRARCLRVERGYGVDVATDILAHAQSTKDRAADLVGSWFKAGTDPLRAWTFLAMGEAAELTTWTVVSDLAERARDGDVAELAAWAAPIQQHHLELALDGAVQLSALFGAEELRWG